MNSDLLTEIHDTARRQGIPVMKDDGLNFLLDYIKKHEGIRDVLEVGTAVGYSAISMASLRWDMRIDTLEIDPDMEKQAVENVWAAGLQDRIHLYLIDGVNFETDKVYDLIFIDAAKSQYRRYMEHFMKNSRLKTVFVFDNLCFHGIVDHEELSQNRSTIQMVHKIHKFRDHLLKDERFKVSFYKDVGDGIAICTRIR